MIEVKKGPVKSSPKRGRPKHMDTPRKFSISMPEGMLEEIKEAIKKEFNETGIILSRSSFLSMAVREKLNRDKKSE